MHELTDKIRLLLWNLLRKLCWPFLWLRKPKCERLDFVDLSFFFVTHSPKDTRYLAIHKSSTYQTISLLLNQTCSFLGLDLQCMRVTTGKLRPQNAPLSGDLISHLCLFQTYNSRTIATWNLYTTMAHYFDIICPHDITPHTTITLHVTISNTGWSMV